MNDLDKVYAESVAKDYMPKETNKVRQLKKLDERAKLPAFISAMTLGIIGTLIFGTGMCFGLGVFGTGAVCRDWQVLQSASLTILYTRSF